LFSLTRQEAGAGAKIVVWPECSGGGVPLMQEDEAALRATARSLSSTYGIYLDMGLCVVPAQPTHLRPLFDESVLLDPVGGELWTYQKAHPIPGAEPFPPGDGQVPLVDTAYGRLASVICFDADFAGTVRQAGEAQTDLLLVPSNDWLAIDPYHTQMASFRAIENGFSEIRTTAHGLSAVVDYAGRVLATSDFYTTDPQVVVADAPAHGVRTAYATIGDWFAWFSLAALALLCAVAILSRARYGYWKSGPQVEPR
jgi:apolipoprotein N-acyltransferase